MKNTFDEVIKKIKKENKLKKLLDIASTKELYAFFQQNGYSKSKNEFEVELENRLKEVAVSLKDSELSKVVGGKKNLTKLTSAGIASLLVLGASPICSKASASDTTCVPDLKTAPMRRLARANALRNETEIPLNDSHLELDKIATRHVRETMKRVYGNTLLGKCDRNSLEVLYELAEVAKENKLFDAEPDRTHIRLETPQRALCFLIQKIWEHSVSTDDNPSDPPRPSNPSLLSRSSRSSLSSSPSIRSPYNDPNRMVRLLAAKVAVEKNRFDDDKKQRLINFIEKFINCYSSSYDDEGENKNVISLLIRSIKYPEITLNKEYLLKIFRSTGNYSPENNTIDKWWFAHELKEFGITIPD